MKRAIIGLLAIYAFAGPVQASDLAATLTIVSSTATTVTVHAAQTGGSQTRLSLRHTCETPTQPTVGVESANVQGSGDFTFNIGPRRYQGQLVTPTHCWALLFKTLPSSTVQILAGIDTLP